MLNYSRITSWKKAPLYKKELNTRAQNAFRYVVIHNFGTYNPRESMNGKDNPSEL